MKSQPTSSISKSANDEPFLQFCVVISPEAADSLPHRGTERGQSHVHEEFFERPLLRKSLNFTETSEAMPLSK